jgi:mannose-6-phosphate isomerase-like protein (cupin superfamily)
MDIANLEDRAPFITLDGSEIRELLAYRNSSLLNQSLAEARLPVGGATQAHYHARAEEIYYITHGHGRIRLGSEEQDVRPGDAIAIPPGSAAVPPPTSIPTRSSLSPRMHPVPQPGKRPCAVADPVFHFLA